MTILDDLYGANAAPNLDYGQVRAHIRSSLRIYILVLTGGNFVEVRIGTITGAGRLNFDLPNGGTDRAGECSVRCRRLVHRRLGRALDLEVTSSRSWTWTCSKH